MSDVPLGMPCRDRDKGMDWHISFHSVVVAVDKHLLHRGRPSSWFRGWCLCLVLDPYLVPYLVAHRLGR